MKNKLIDLNNHLFEQLERLNDEDLTGEQLQSEIQRSKAVSGIASQIVSNASLSLEAKKHQAEWQGTNNSKLPKMIEETTNA